MKEINLYQCEICGTQYASSKAAQDCEKSHKTIESIESAKYRSLKSNPDGYPDKITVVFSDNKQVTYHR